MQRRKFISQVTAATLGMTFCPTGATAGTVKQRQRFRLPLHYDRITEAWLYKNELQYHPTILEHKGIDYAAKYRTPVYATARGKVLGSFHTAKLADRYVDKATGKSHELGFGLGYFVQIYHPELEVFSSYSHLDSIELSNVPFIEPVKDKGLWSPDVVYEPLNTMLDYCWDIEQGDLIGFVGNSGLSMDYDEEPWMERDPTKLVSWDEFHLHFEGPYQRNEKGLKTNRKDPYNRHTTAEAYGHGNRQAKGGVWDTNFFGYIRYAN